MIEQQCPQFLKRKRNDKQCHLATTKSLRWLGSRVFRPLRVSGRTTGLGGEDCFGTLTVWELLSGSLEQDSLSGGTLKGALVFGGLTAGLGMVRLSDRWVYSGMWMGSGLPLVHAGSLLFRRCLLFLLKIPVSILGPDFIWSHIQLLLYTSLEPSTRPVCRLYTHNFSFSQGGSSLALML